MYALQTMLLESDLKIDPNRPWVRKLTMMSKFSNMTSSSICFDVGRVFIVNFSYREKFQVHIVIASRVMTIFLCKGLTRSPDIGNIPV